jgi:hypothetical protein
MKHEGKMLLDLLSTIVWKPWQLMNNGAWTVNVIFINIPHYTESQSVHVCVPYRQDDDAGPATAWRWCRI